MKKFGGNAVALGRVESQPSQSAREVTLLTCPAEYSGAQVSAQKTGANLWHQAQHLGGAAARGKFALVPGETGGGEWVVFQFWAAYDADIMDEKRIRERISELIELATGRPVSVDTSAQVVQGAASLIALLYGPRSAQQAAFETALAEERKRIAKHWRESQPVSIAEMVAGVLRNVGAELDAGLIGSIKQQAAAEVLTDFIALSRAALEEKGDQAKNVAAVLAAAVFEDTIRRLGVAHAGADPREELSEILIKLKKSGLLQAPQVGIAQSYLNFRNHALHANWDSIQREAVHSVLGFVEQLVLKHFQ